MLSTQPVIVHQTCRDIIRNVLVSDQTLLNEATTARTSMASLTLSMLTVSKTAVRIGEKVGLRLQLVDVDGHPMDVKYAQEFDNAVVFHQDVVSGVSRGTITIAHFDGINAFDADFIAEEAGRPTSITATIKGQQLRFQPQGPSIFPTITVKMFWPVAPLVEARTFHTATQLKDARVLLFGGFDDKRPPKPRATVETYSHKNESFTLLPSVANVGRSYHTATLDPVSGQVVMIGGVDGDYGQLSSIECFQPETSSFHTAAGSLRIPRYQHTATYVPYLKCIVIIGGFIDGSGSFVASSAPQSTSVVELYDPLTETMTVSTATLNFPRGGHTSTLMPSGQIAVIGGQVTDTFPDTIELFDPVTQSFRLSSTKLNVPRLYHTTTLLPQATQVLIAGGNERTGWHAGSVELFDEATDKCQELSFRMFHSRVHHTATYVPRANLLLFAGGNMTVTDAEAFHVSKSSFVREKLPFMNSTRMGHTATVITGTGQVLLAGGAAVEYNNRGVDTWRATNAAEIF